MAFESCFETMEGSICSRGISMCTAQKSDTAVNLGNRIGGLEIRVERSVTNWRHTPEGCERDPGSR